jgi:hypothetical protein
MKIFMMYEHEWSKDGRRAFLQELEKNASVQIKGNKNLENNEEKIKNVKIF